MEKPSHFIKKIHTPKQCTIQVRKCINIHDIQMLCDLKWNFWYLTYYDLFTQIHNYLKFKGCFMWVQALSYIYSPIPPQKCLDTIKKGNYKNNTLPTWFRKHIASLISRWSTSMTCRKVDIFKAENIWK